MGFRRFRRIAYPLTVVMLIATCEDEGCGSDPALPPIGFSGTVYVNDVPYEGATVSTGGMRTTTTANGRYTLSGVLIASVTVSGVPGVTFIDNGRTVTLPVSGDIDFHGYRHVRVYGRVLIGAAPVAGAVVSLTGSIGLSEETIADANGAFEFTDVPPSVGIGYTLRVTSSHPGATFTGLLASLSVRGQDVQVDLVGTLLGTGIHGSVVWDGQGLPGVTVTATGEGRTVTRVTDDAGAYRTGLIGGGDYTVTISGYDAAAYPFPVTMQTVTLAGTAQVDFIGASNRPPVATILMPSAGDTVAAGVRILFTGDATDPEDGALPNAALEWSSDVDGPLGSGRAFGRTLAAGTHTITLIATDADGAADTASVTVDAVVNQPPTVAITSPGDGAVLAPGSQTQFTGTASDPEDGPLTGAALVWTANGSVIGSGTSITASLPEGFTTVTLTATDRFGVATSTSIEVYTYHAGEPAGS